MPHTIFLKRGRTYDRTLYLMSCKKQQIWLTKGARGGGYSTLYQCRENDYLSFDV